jgi:hypothetical protein
MIQRIYDAISLKDQLIINNTRIPNSIAFPFAETVL